MKTTEQTFEAPDGLQLFYRAWLPDGEPREAVALIPGYGDHSARHASLGEHLAGAGFAVYACDLRGNGRSHGTRAHVDTFDEYVADMAVFFDLVRERAPRERVTLVGHSLGGLIALAYTEKHPRAPVGLILSSPFLKLRIAVPEWRARFVHLAAKITPTSPIGNPVKGEMLSRDPAVVEAYDADPLVHDLATVGWADEVLRAQGRVRRHAEKVTCPLLVVYSPDDPVSDPAAIESLVQKVTVPDKTVLRYDGYLHETYNDVGNEVVLGDIEAWLAKRANRRRLI
jgi:alpha-beta hydrolase superfamily lysophospholipase